MKIGLAKKCVVFAIILCVQLSLSCHQVAIQRTELHEWTVRYVHREMQSQLINQTTMQLSIANVNKYITWFNYYNPTNGHVHCAAFVLLCCVFLWRQPSTFTNMWNTWSCDMVFFIFYFLLLLLLLLLGWSINGMPELTYSSSGSDSGSISKQWEIKRNVLRMRTTHNTHTRNRIRRAGMDDRITHICSDGVLLSSSYGLTRLSSLHSSSSFDPFPLQSSFLHLYV